MKKVLLVFLLMSSLTTVAQQMFTDEDGVKIVKGKFTRHLLVKDPAFKWFSEAYTHYKVDEDAIHFFKQLAPKVVVKVYCGTWCEDTKKLLPGFFKTIDALGVPEENITLIGLDRDKKSGIDKLDNSDDIGRIPHFIFYYENVQIGEIVEFVDNSIEMDMSVIYVDFQTVKE
jgi:hypothetical protein